MNKRLFKDKILSVGFSSFPLGFAQVQRQILLAKCLIVEGYDVTVLCRYGIHGDNDRVEASGLFEKIKYIYCSGTPVRPDSYLRRNLLKLWGLIKEAGYMRKFSRDGTIAALLISTNNFHNVMFYYLCGKILRIKTIIDNVEYWTSFPNLTGLNKIEKFLYDHYYFHFTDNIICISDFLINKIPVSKQKKTLKIPAITDFKQFNDYNSDQRLVGEKYFLFCGADVYFEVIEFIITAFEHSGLSNFNLVLVTKPTEKLISRIKAGNCEDSIRIFFNLPYPELINLYINSEALLIPIRNTDQDKARFPHKISEYCASRRPIITNRTGEITNYFSEKSAFLCNNYDLKEYSRAMKDVISDPVRAGSIARESYETGLRHFNYESYSKVLSHLIRS